MTILIKGMKMPKKGYKDIRIHADGSWTAYAETVPYNDIYGAAVEVPTPHGRLIDADDFDSRIRAAGGLADEELTDDFKDGVLSVLTLMKTQNTVIEAEKNNNGKLHEL